MKSDLRSSNTAQWFLRRPLPLAVAAAFAAGIGGPAQAVVLFNVVDLGMPSDTSSNAQGVNAAGQVAGHAGTNSGSVAFSWQGGARTVLGFLGGTLSGASSEVLHNPPGLRPCDGAATVEIFDASGRTSVIVAHPVQK